MKIKKLALEGDISLRLLVILVIVTLCYAIIDTSIQFGDIDEEGIIFLTLESLSFPVIVLSMLYLPKVTSYIPHCLLLLYLIPMYAILCYRHISY